MEDEELEKIKQKKLQEMIQKQKEMNEIKNTEILELNSSNFESVIANNSLVLVDFLGRMVWSL